MTEEEKKATEAAMASQHTEPAGEAAGTAAGTEGEASGTASGDVPRGRAALRSRYKERFPDRNWDEEDDDALADQAIADYDDMEGRLKAYDEEDAKMQELMEKNPQSAAFLIGMARGEDFLANLQKNFGEDIVEAMQNPEKLKELSAANKEYHEKIADMKKAQEQWEANMTASLENLRQAREESGVTDEQVADAMDKLIGVVDAYNTGNIDMETIKFFLNGINHDTDVEDAARKAEVRGRNANIEEQQRRRKQSADGIPQLGGQVSRGGQGRTFSNPLEDNSAGNGIWKNANLKRNIY